MISSTCARRRRRAARRDAAQRLAELDPCLGAGLATELDHLAQLGHLREQRLVRLAGLRPAGEEHRVGRALARAGDEVPPELVGEEGHDRRDYAHRLYQRPPERLDAARRHLQKRRRERRMYQFERSSTNARTRVVTPGRPVLVECGVVPPTSSAVRARRASGRGRASTRPASIGVRRPEVLDVRVGDEERDGVPERQQPPLHLAGRAVAELDVLRWRERRRRASA